MREYLTLACLAQRYNWSESLTVEIPVIGCVGLTGLKGEK